MTLNARTPHTYARGELVVVIDVADLERAADFWTHVLGYVRDPIVEFGWTWHVLADPDDNEFCVLQPPAALP
jgi:predicted enzyme related to lactoylglutathione lyase